MWWIKVDHTNLDRYLNLMVVSNASIKIYEIDLNPEVLCIFTFKSKTEILFNELIHRYYLHIVKDIKMTWLSYSGVAKGKPNRQLPIVIFISNFFCPTFSELFINFLGNIVVNYTDSELESESRRPCFSESKWEWLRRFFSESKSQLY